MISPSTFKEKPYTWEHDDEPSPVPDWLPDSAGAASKGSGQEIIKDWTVKVVDGRERLWRD